MIVVDTNVVSHLMKRASRRDPRILAWFSSHPPRDLSICAPVVAEIRAGLAVLPPEHPHRTELLAAADHVFDVLFPRRCLSFDRDAAAIYADIAAVFVRERRMLPIFDLQIAAIARSCGYRVATLNRRDFDGLDVEILSPDMET